VTIATGRRLRAWLKTSRRSQVSLAKELGISTPYISMLLAGQRTPSLPVAKRLQEITGIPAAEFASTRSAAKQRIA
jgi:transcriptional regulator with XRE-family HTH domain